MRSSSLAIGSGLRLPWRAQRQALRALSWLVAADLAVRLLPYANVLRLLDRIPANRRGNAALSPADCAIAIRRAARVYPLARCLARAVAASCMLCRAGRRVVPSLGVGFDQGRRFEAHAWLECDGVMITGGEEAARFAPLRATSKDA